MHGIIRIEVRDRRGLLTHTEEQPMRSPLKAFLQILLMRMGAADVATVKDTGGTDRTIDQSDTTKMMDATGGSGDADTGIVVGTGTTAVAIDDNVLATLIAHGTGGGQMEYGTQTNPSDVSDSGTQANFVLYRTFTNSSGSAIVVAEVGLYVKQMYTGAGTGVFCIARDLVTATSIADSGTTSLFYIFRIEE